MFGKHETDVLVVGAGPVGLFSALALAARGVKTEVVEEQWRGASRSYALALHPESVRLLGELGLGGELAKIGRPVRKLRFMSGSEPRAELDLSRLGGAETGLLVLPQYQLEDVLAEALRHKSVPVHWSHRLAAFDAEGNRLKVQVERLEKESFGYSVTHTEWVVSRTLDYRSRFLLGADGHRSLVRRRLNLDFAPAGEPSTFAVFEFAAAGGPSELNVVLDGGLTSVLWPLPEGRFRWSFQLPAEEAAEPRVKSRLLVQIRDESFPHVGREELDRLIAERAPWFDGRIDEVLWSAVIRFERRRANRFGQGRAWIVGDAAHLASPVAIRSMNVGLREARDWADRVGRILAGGGAEDLLEEFDSYWRRRWDVLEGLSQTVEVTAEANPWVAARAGRVADCVPASGVDLQRLLAQLGIKAQVE
jgi:2-polyprenyl-6-methoxyphenol hydroxylase-like FAD-dependent oxidoreductase